MLSIGHYLFLGLALFIIGVIGVVTRRNVIVILMSIELILNAVNINLVAFSRLYGDVAGQVFALFIIADAAAEAAVGLGIIIAFFRNRETVLEDEMDLLKWSGCATPCLVAKRLCKENNSHDADRLFPRAPLAHPAVSADNG